MSAQSSPKANSGSRESPVAFQYLFRNHPIPMWIYDRETLAFLDVNDAAIQHYGYSRNEFLALTIQDIRPPEDVGRLMSHLDQGRLPLRMSGDWRHQRKDGSVIQVEITSHTIDYDGRAAVMVTALDVTARVAAERSLQRAEAQYRLLAENAHDFILMHDHQGRITYANAAALRFLGYTADELIGLDVQQLVPADERPQMQERATARRAGQTERYLYETTLINRAGRPLPVEVNSSAIVEDDAVSQLLLVVRDIRERKQAEERIRKLNRLYAVLSNINQTIVRVRDFDRLCQETCRIAVELGGFQAVWLVMVDDSARGMRLVAQAGSMPGFLRPMTEGRDAPLLQNLPVQRAIAEGEHVVVNRIAHDRRAVQWKDQALAHDCRAAAAFPFFVDGQVRGALGFYASEPDFFDEQELGLLDELAMDMGYALEFMVREEQLRLSEQRRALAQKAGGIGVWELNAATRTLMWDRQMYDIYGVSPETFAGDYHAWERLVHPDDRQKAAADSAPILQGAESYHSQFRIIRPDGDVRVVESHGLLLHNEEGGADRIIGVNWDVTERVQTEQQLRLQSAALESAANAIVITDIRGAIEWVNSAFTELTGYSAQEALGANLGDLVRSGEQDRAFYRELWETITAGEVWHGELVNRRKDGTPYVEEQTITPLMNEDGRVTHFIAIKQNIDDRKRLAAENERLTVQFYRAQRLDSIGRLAGGVAHDFNNLLVPMVGYAELGMLRSEPDSVNHRNFARIKEAADRAADLVRQILAFSRRQLLEMQELNLNDLILNFHRMIQRLLREDIELATFLAEQPCIILGDQGQLEQVLMNLLVNARDAMPNGGLLTVETSVVTLDDEHARRYDLSQGGQYVLLAVSDTGHGMDAGIIQRIFEPFFTTKELGNGLGLATVFGIIKQHSGGIVVYSEPGYGTTFKVLLPLVGGDLHLEPTEQEEGLELHGTETILVVEDEESVRELVCDTLTSHGYQVLHAATAEAGLELADDHNAEIALLLTDVVMPGMNGRELYEQLAARRPLLQVLFMSGYTDDVVVRRGVLQRDAGFLQKPFAIHELLGRVRTVLGDTAETPPA